MKKKLWMFFFFLALITTYLIVDTYALLESKGSGSFDVPVGQWHITLNDINILETNEISLSDLVYAPNANVEPGYFAPGVSASYEIVIDPSGTDVAIRYDLAIDPSAVSTHPNVIFKASSDTITSSDGGLTYSGFISLEEIEDGDLITIQIIFNWEQISAYDQLDSTLMGEDATLAIPITIAFSQYAGEPL